MPAKVTSLGLFILDTFLWRSVDGSKEEEKQESVVGGGGTYAIIGARMWLPPDQIGIVVDRGNDFPVEIQEALDWYGKEIWCYRDKDRPTTRALNLYTGEHRDFKYLNERDRLEPIDFPPPLRSSNWLHFVCSPTRALVIHSQLLPPLNTTPSWSPKLCFEPIPDRCTPEELPSLRKVLPHLSVFSPNHEEAAAFFGIGVEQVKMDGKEGIERVAERFYEEGATKAVVIRCGALGAYSKASPTSKGFWIPAFHTDQSKVVDVTGGGNTFLGGLMGGLERVGEADLRGAVEMASVSASFVIEQFGLPQMSKGEERDEKWNGDSPMRRLKELQERTQ